MRITVFNGSPRHERGNTHVMVSGFLEGAKDAGAEVENIFLAGKEIKPCIACYACWTKTPGKCVHDDDVPDLLDRYLASDIVGFASPVYVDNVTGLMKNFMDRLIATGDPHMEPDEHGECRHVKSHDRPSAIAAISNCGFPEQTHFQVLHLLFTRMARNLQCDLIAEIYRGGGGLLTSPLQEAREAVEKYRALLRKAGEEVVRMRHLSRETVAELEKPLMHLQSDTHAYIEAVNRMWDSRLANTGKGREPSEHDE
jgi:multimeric flavodoxin WrbA